MFTPEFSSTDAGEFVLVANHSLESHESTSLSVEFNRARIAFGLLHAPASMQRCKVIYDIRGQNVPDANVQEVRDRLALLCTLEFKR